tara:strand:+ start:388 stop:1059 length:672 start_codon:yes stop_codon:yes gene_type:complete
MPNGRRRQQNTRHSNHQRNIDGNSVIIASPVSESVSEPEQDLIVAESYEMTPLDQEPEYVEDLLQRAHIDKGVYELRIENLKKRISTLYEYDALAELEVEINIMQIRFKKLKKQFDTEKKKSEEIQTLNSKYKDKIKYLLIELEKSQKKNKNMNDTIKKVEKSTEELVTVTMTNKQICSDLTNKLNRVRTELPVNFETPEWNNKHFVNFLIDLTLDELIKFKF